MLLCFEARHPMYQVVPGVMFLSNTNNISSTLSRAGWIHCYANLADMYKTQKRFEDASNLLAQMPWLPTTPQRTAPSSTAAAEEVQDSTTGKTPPSNPGSGDQIPAVHLAAASRGTSDTTTTTTAADGTQIYASKSSTNPEGDNGSSSPASKKEGTGPESSPSREQQHGGGKDESGGVDPVPSSAARGGEGARSEASPARGAGAARVAGLNKAAAAASAAAAAESAAAAAAAVETRAEAAARAVVERHAEAMRASMNELVGELAVTTATRPSASQDWLDSRVVAAEEVREKRLPFFVFGVVHGLGQILAGRVGYGWPDPTINSEGLKNSLTGPDPT